MLEGIYLIYQDNSRHKIPAEIKSLDIVSKNPIAPDQMVLDVPGDVAIGQLDEVVFFVSGIPIFQGFVSKRERNENNYEIELQSNEWLLDFRPIQEFIYHNSTLSQILSSEEPIAGGTVGALFRINSEILNGAWEYYSATIAKLSNAGRKSQIGNSGLIAYTTFPNAGSIDAGDGIHPLTELSGIPASGDEDAFYRSEDHLLVKFADGSYRENAFLVAAPNKFDTKLRLGSIEIGLYKNTADFSLLGQASSVLSDLFEKCGMETQIISKQDGYRYINLATTIARGSEADPVKSYVNGRNNCEVSLEDQLEPNYNAVIGINSGDSSQVPLVVTDWGIPTVGPFIHKIHDSADKDGLANEIQLLINNNGKSFKIVSYDVDFFLRVGDWISVTHETYGTFSLRVQCWSYNGDEKKQEIMVGKRVFSASDYFGDYFRGEIPGNGNPLSTTAIADGSGSFTIKKGNVDEALRIYYEDSFSQSDDGTQSEIGTFMELFVNNKIIPPGRLKLLNGGSVQIDITAYCNMSSSEDKSNTVLRRLYRATGWGADEDASKVTQWKTLKFLEA